MSKCYCGFVWEDRFILRGFEEDEGGIFFSCPLDPEEYDLWNNCTGYISKTFGNGTINELYPKLLKRYQEIKKEQEIKKIQKKHKFTLENFS
jgi:hypothetical protein